MHLDITCFLTLWVKPHRAWHYSHAACASFFLSIPCGQAIFTAFRFGHRSPPAYLNYSLSKVRAHVCKSAPCLRTILFRPSSFRGWKQFRNLAQEFFITERFGI